MNDTTDKSYRHEYVIGDLQGCFDAFNRLLLALDFDENLDKIWLCGDIVARGENSLDTLRQVKRLSDKGALQTVLGNHDITLIATWRGILPIKPKDNTTPLSDKRLTCRRVSSDVITDMHFMLQKEVVDRITAEPNTKAYGRLSVIMQYHCTADYLLTVPNGAFNPPPKVTSAAFRLTPFKEKPMQAKNDKLFADIVRETFNHRRKTLRAIFKSVSMLPTLDDEDFDKANINPQARPETLSVADFVRLSDVAFAKLGKH